MADRNVKTILGCIRRADKQFGLIRDGDRVLAGISGGKDSLVLLHALGLYRRFFPGHFTLYAATLDLGLAPVDTDSIAALCRNMGVSYTVRPTGIGPIIFGTRKEKNPCALCAKMRRGALHDVARQLGCNKVALGHHREDVLETFLLSLLHEGRVSTFSPLTYMSRSDIVQIRPMVYVPEKIIVSAARKLKLPVSDSPCPAAGHTRREDMKALLAQFHKLQPDAEHLMIRALGDTAGYRLWDKVSGRPEDLPAWWLEDGDKP